MDFFPVFVLQVHFAGCGRTAVISSSAASLPISSQNLQIVSCSDLHSCGKGGFGDIVWDFNHTFQNLYIFLICPFGLFWDNFTFLPGFQGGLLSIREILSAVRNLLLMAGHPCSRGSEVSLWWPKPPAPLTLLKSHVWWAQRCSPVDLTWGRTLLCGREKFVFHPFAAFTAAQHCCRSPVLLNPAFHSHAEGLCFPCSSAYTLQLKGLMQKIFYSHQNNPNSFLCSLCCWLKPTGTCRVHLTHLLLWFLSFSKLFDLYILVTKFVMHFM